MSDPLFYLLAVGVAIAAVAWVLWPGSGAWHKWRRRRGVTRPLLEDALKHLYDCEYSGIAGTINSVSGSLGISSDHASAVVRQLETMTLVTSLQSGVLSLSVAGRAYALRIIRIHRLWERYLADETGMAATDWHRQAEEIEHRLTPAQANDLAARMGNPLVDPHGDPIPSSSGEVRSRPGTSLAHMNPGDTVEIVHIEDEPHAMYAQLVAERLYVGQHLRILAVETDRIQFEADGDECILAPLLAGQLTVKKVEHGDDVHASHRTLDTLPRGEAAVVAGISRACRGLQRRRLMDLGVVPGSVIVPELDGPSGDPQAYRIRGALIALRSEQSRQIFVRMKEAAKGMI